MCHYFIYRAAAGPDRPSLQLLPNPYPRFFRDDEVGLLPRGNHFTVAALSRSGVLEDGAADDDHEDVVISNNTYYLHLFRSEDGAWTSEKVAVKTPQRPFQIPIPEISCRLYEHYTVAVITLGGEGETMGFVDLWRGILLCDLRSTDHSLRGIPLPLPSSQHLYAEGVEGCARPYRGIAVVDGCLKLLHLDVQCELLGDLDPETLNGPHYRVDGWTLTTYTNTRRMSNSWEDWELDCKVEASGILMDSAVCSQLLHSGLLRKDQNLENIWAFQPALSLDDKGIVYLFTRARFRDPKSWVLAVDMKNSRLQALSEFGDTDFCLSNWRVFCPSRISSFLKTTIDMPAPHVLVESVDGSGPSAAVTPSSMASRSLPILDLQEAASTQSKEEKREAEKKTKDDKSFIEHLAQDEEFWSKLNDQLETILARIEALELKQKGSYKTI